MSEFKNIHTLTTLQASSCCVPYIAADSIAQQHTWSKKSDKKGRITATHGWFNGIRKVVPVCTPPNTRCFGPLESTTRTTSRSIQPFLHNSWQCHRACTSMSFSVKTAPLHGAITTPS